MSQAAKFRELLASRKMIVAPAPSTASPAA